MGSGNDLALLNLVYDYNDTTLLQKYSVLGRFSQTLKVEASQSQSLAKMLILRGFVVYFFFFMCASNFFHFLRLECSLTPFLPTLKKLVAEI